MASDKKKSRSRRQGLGRIRAIIGACLAMVVALNHNAIVSFCIAAIMTCFHTEISFNMWWKDSRHTMGQLGDALREEVFWKPGESRESQICRTSMYTKLAEEAYSGIIMTPLSDSHVTLPKAKRAEAYLEACLEAFKTLPEEARQHLLALDPMPPPSQFHGNLTHPWLNGRYLAAMFPDQQSAQFGVAWPDSWDVFNGWELERKRVASALPKFERKTPQDLSNFPQRFLEGFRELDLWPVKDTWIHAPDIPAAMLQGLTAVFDATELCGREVFNLTIPQIAELHGPLANGIPAFRTSSSGLGDDTYDTLAELAMRFTNWDTMGWQSYPEFGPFPDWTKMEERDARVTPSSWVLDMLIRLSTWKWEEKQVRKYWQGWMRDYRMRSTQTTINLQRLPRLPIQDMHKNMASPDWVQRTWSLLWIGPVADFWHYDEADNLLISLSGDIYVAVMEQNYTELVSGTRNIGLGWNNLEAFYQRRKPGEAHWVDANPWIRKVPIHFVKLEPGMGITVPSKTYHNVMTSDGNRVLLNCFMIPRWRTHTRGWFTPGTQSDAYMAMWHLKSASLWRLWDTKRVGGYFSGLKLEFL